MRVDVLGTFLRDAPTKDARLSSAMKELVDKDVTWQITVQREWTAAQKDDIRSGGGTPETTDAITYRPGSQFTQGQTLRTIVLEKAADAEFGWGKILGHELAHVSRNPNGSFLSEDQIRAIDANIYYNVFQSGRTINPSGSSIESSVTAGTYGNDLIYATIGNSVIDAGSGNNTVVSYGGNDLLVAKYGSDFFSIEGRGAKAIKDGGGSDTVYLSWVRSTDDIEFRLEDDGTLYMSLLGADPVVSPERLAIFNWGQGYGTGAIEWLRYTDTYGRMTNVNLTLTARRWLGFDSEIATYDASLVATSHDQSSLSAVHNIIGTPVSEYAHHFPGASQLIVPAYGQTPSLVSDSFAVGG